MKVWVVYEYEFHELYDLKIFSSEAKAKEYKTNRFQENSDFYETDMAKHVVGFDIKIDQQEVL
jgi:hypothetical protein